MIGHEMATGIQGLGDPSLCLIVRNPDVEVNATVPETFPVQMLKAHDGLPGQRIVEFGIDDVEPKHGTPERPDPRR